MKKLTVLSICVVLVFGLSISSSATASDEEDALQVVTNFYKAMNTLNYDLMSSVWLHSQKTSSYEPGGDPFVYEGWEAIGDSWQSGLTSGSSSEEATTVYAHNFKATLLTDNIALITGYDSNLVRVTWVVQKDNGKWKIVHQHSSVLPME